MIPFRWMPGSWGLVGEAYEIAEAHYYLTGEALERRLLEIRLRDQPDLLALELLQLDHKFGHVSAYDFNQKRAMLTHPEGVERDLALLEVEHQHGKLSDASYEKQRAILKNEPWISIINSGLDPDAGIDGVFFEFDWNAQWIEFLRKHGYSGHTDEQVVDEWFSEVCRSHVQSADTVPFSIAMRDP